MESSKVFLLSLLVLQTTTYVLLGKYVFRRQGPKINSMVLVFFIEVCKLVFAMLLYLCEVKSCLTWLKDFWKKVLDMSSFLKVAGLSLMYVAQNNAAYIALQRMGAAKFQVTYQIKIPITTILCVLILKKQISKGQWVAVLCLTTGVALTQMSRTHGKSRKNVDEQVEHSQFLVGTGSLLVAALLSSLAGIYNEKLLKDTPSSIWIVNIQMYITGIVTSVIAILVYDSSLLQLRGLGKGVDGGTICLIALGSFGGMVISLVLKHTDNVLKSFAVGISIVFSTGFSFLLFNEHLGSVGLIGAMFVVIAIPLYAKFRVTTESVDVEEDLKKVIIQSEKVEI